jgi:2-C-methyl-D-erythritol 4-phosphate cytidylyltransferase
MAVALIAAAGSGERLQADRPKALVELAGRPLLQWSLDVLGQVEAIERIVVALPREVLLRAIDSREPATSAGASGLPRGLNAPAGTIGVAGGKTRSASVRLALAAAGAGDPVLVHDAARPLLTAELVDEMLSVLDPDTPLGAEGVDGATAAAPVTDTIKRTDEGGIVLETLARARLWTVQTPQVFRRSALERALAVPDHVLAAATDDAWLLERGGGKVIVVPAPPENLKVTTALDLIVAETRLEHRGAGPAAGRE